jgi:SAM-dependent methyltransferase
MRRAARLRPLLPFGPLRTLFRAWLAARSAGPDARESTRELLLAYDDVYRRLDEAAARYDDGVHAKHRLMRYHDFFVERVRPQEHVLDVGCGKGELAHDLVVRRGATVVGIDSDPRHLAFARSRFVHERLEFVAGDVTETLPAGHFDVVVLSNVLEHLEERVALLERVVDSADPARLLVRVPLLTRDWTVPLRRELGLPYFWDDDHKVEYEPASLRAELGEAGLAVTELTVNWGEIWAAAQPSRT